MTLCFQSDSKDDSNIRRREGQGQWSCNTCTWNRQDLIILKMAIRKCCRVYIVNLNIQFLVPVSLWLTLNWYLQGGERKCTHIFSFRKYAFQCQQPLNFADVSIFCRKSVFFCKNSTFTQSNNMRAVLEIFSSVFSFCKINGYY